MDGLKNLPAPVRIAIAAVILCALGLGIWMTLLRQPAPSEVFTSRDYDLTEAAQTVLTRKGIEHEVEQSGASFTIMVPREALTDAATALEQSGIKDRTGLAKAKTCPAAPGFTASPSAQDSYNNCEKAKEIQANLIAAGLLAANVSVSTKEGSGFEGEQVLVAAQVFLPRDMRDGTWRADQAAENIAQTAGTDLEHVVISDDRLQELFNGSKREGGSTSDGELGCMDIEGATEIQTKRTAVKNCLDQEISEKLVKLLGNERVFVLSVDPRIDSVARSTTTMQSSSGAVTTRSSQSGGGSSSMDTATQPSTSQTNAIDPAGDIARLTINVTLDRQQVTRDQEIAVRSMLAGYRDLRRKDPMPVVTRARIAAAAGVTAEQQPATGEQGGGMAAADRDLPVAPARPVTPRWAIALIAVLAIGIVMSIIMLLRRSSQMRRERERIEQSFAQEQRLFEDFAQQNPDQLASDLNALFGAPSAPEPTYRS